MGLASPSSQTAACPAATNQQRFLFVFRPANGGYNFSGGGNGVYSNASMPNYVPAGEEGVVGGGNAGFFDVVDGGGNVNSAGAVSSSAGQVIGKIVWDVILLQWIFVGKESRDNHMNQIPSSGSGASVDATQIKTFLAVLNNGTQQFPYKPNRNVDNSLNNSNDSGDTIG